MSDKIQTQMWLNATTHAALKNAARIEGVSMARLVDEILQYALPLRVERHTQRLDRMRVAAGEVS
tara:strand:- start:113 stop:307 length:195 start_codon:yes stop_codon:yes gene_type:complete